MKTKENGLSVFTPRIAISGGIAYNDLAVVVDATGLIVKSGALQDVGGWVYAQRRDHHAKIVVEQVGGLLIPGLTDAHTHPALYASLAMMSSVSLYGCTTVAEIINRLRPAPLSGSIIATGWNNSVVPSLSGRDLDEAFPDRKVIVYDPSFHGAIVSRPMGADIEELLRSRPHVAGCLTKDGRATEDCGLAGMEVGESAFSQLELEMAIEALLLKYLKQGITGVHDLCMRTEMQIRAVLSLRNRWQEKYGFEFPITRIYLRPEHITFLVNNLPDLESEGLFTGSDFRRMVGLKLFADGSFGARTAALSQPYLGTGCKGLWFDSPEYVEDSLCQAAKHGITTVAMHAIGDSGVQEALLTAKRWQKLASTRGFSQVFRIEHFELPLPLKETLQMAKDLGVWVCPQPNFLLDAPYRDRLGDRVEWICPHRAILDAEINTMTGTDGMPDSNLYAIYLATHAKYAHQRLSLPDAIDAATVAVGRFEGDNRGTLAEGQKADLLVADELLHKMLIEGDADDVYDPNKITALERQIKEVYKSGQPAR
ncbi:MAG: hypothetical protein A2664_03620 [Candidatus Taylorbacteria bacterium RIFCSPHIGHO2_01_FULL_46_22b]|uniref:Amidohydrolase 3 domain-containing protein n=1 Tax=Candidatus Taylorbacteria bacterium RIFCSPHIGHO2_01_FULL_46_22b TaxID=1802301 RepID=A0A1G2M3K1_9BACT|nr:MAG: hypothetical protein A2664_03620 [Candidatus Taylorbacteria bacterium RIFCSPHIGHO2_01_FULL_46_22b]